MKMGRLIVAVAALACAGGAWSQDGGAGGPGAAAAATPAGAGGALPVWHRDGSVALALPEWVGGIEVHNIRPGAADASSFGSVRINAIDLSRTTVTLSPK